MILNAFIIEDEIKAIELLQSYIKQIPFINLLGQSRDPVNALERLPKSPIDVIFLDINLPHLSGIDFYTKLIDPPKVIFTTAYPEYAVKGFELEAIDYLLKPITFNRFLKACQRLASEKQLIELSNTNHIIDLIYIKSGVTIHKLEAREILYLEKDENYVVYHTKNKKKILSRQTLNDLENTLPDYFIRIHKSFIVSLLHIESIRTDQLKIQDKKLPIGKTFRSSINQFLKNPQS